MNTSIVLQGNLGTTTTVNGTPQRSGGDLAVMLGRGGEAFASGPLEVGPTGTAGAGGSWDWFSTTKNPVLLESVSRGTHAAIATQALASFHLEAGAGGQAGTGTGGAGGAILGGAFHFGGPLGILGSGGFNVLSGGGGDSDRAGADAGRIEGAVFSFAKTVQLMGSGNDFTVSGGRGGILAAETGGRAGGGTGGALQRLVFDFHETVAVGGDFGFRSGRGGTNYGRIGNGGNGGALNGLAILSAGDIVGELVVGSGPGGGVGDLATLSIGQGGAGGDITNLLIQAPNLDRLTLGSGSGGESTGLGTGGRGGNLSTGLGLMPHPAVDAPLEARLHTRAGVYIPGALGRLDLDLGNGGNGGDGNSASNEPFLYGGSGGRGGSLVSSTFVLGSVSSELHLGSGGGGNGMQRAAGGRSGGIDHVSLQVSGDVGGNVSIALGEGGMNDAPGRTGAGGNYSHLSLAVGGDVVGTVFINAPNGGAGTPGSTIVAAPSGSIDHLHLELGDILGGTVAPPSVSVDGPGKYGLQVTGGTGHDAARGGAGGSITDSFISTGTLTFGAYIVAGDGGVSSGLGAGRAGGSITGSTLTFRGDLGGNLVVQAGRGSHTEQGAAGQAGALRSTDITLAGALDVKIAAGNAGQSAGGLPATGGAIDGLTLENTGHVRNLNLFAGSGTGNVEGVRPGGVGGAIVGSTWSNFGGVEVAQVTAGDGGIRMGEHHGDGGAGGAIVNFTFNNAAPTSGLALFSAGAGGSLNFNGPDPRGNGGHGGGITGFVLHDSAGPDSVVTIRAGEGDEGVGKTGRGGNGGSVLGTRLDTLGTVILMGGGAGAVNSDGTQTAGGAGGWVSGVTGSVGHLSVLAGRGGSAAHGGNGGSVRSVNLSEVTGFVRLLQAGSGGYGTYAGHGGSIAFVSVPGDIGDFHSAFGLGNGWGESGMGGLVAGAGGNVNLGYREQYAGRVSYVTATRIAAIFALGSSGDGSNAVGSIFGVRALEIGADTGLPGTAESPALRGYGTFTYNGTAPFENYSDTPIDGPVIVWESGFDSHSLSVLPLYLVPPLNR